MSLIEVHASPLRRSERLAAKAFVGKLNSTFQLPASQSSSVGNMHSIRQSSSSQPSETSSSAASIAISPEIPSRRAKSWPLYTALSDPIYTVDRRIDRSHHHNLHLRRTSSSSSIVTEPASRPNLANSFQKWLFRFLLVTLIAGHIFQYCAYYSIGYMPPSPVVPTTANSALFPHISLEHLSWVHFPDLYLVLQLDRAPFPVDHPYRQRARDLIADGSTANEETLVDNLLTHEIDRQCRRLRSVWQPDRHTFRQPSSAPSSASDRHNRDSVDDSTIAPYFSTQTPYNWTHPLWPKPWAVLGLTCEILRTEDKRQLYDTGKLDPQALIRMAFQDGKGHFASLQSHASPDTPDTPPLPTFDTSHTSPIYDEPQISDPVMADVLSICRAVTKELESSEEKNKEHYNRRMWKVAGFDETGEKLSVTMNAEGQAQDNEMRKLLWPKRPAKYSRKSMMADEVL